MTLLSPATVDFLTQLRDNNNRAWFTANKADYDGNVRLPAEAFAAVLAAQLESRTGTPQDPRIFRLHRDLRFSRDKTPYNTHLHISFSPAGDGRKGGPAWMFGLDPDGLTVGTGIFAFSPRQLDCWRTLVAGGDGPAVASQLDQLVAQAMRIGEPELKRVPGPFAADHPCAAMLRRKGLTAWIDCTDASIAFGSEGPARCASELLRLSELYGLLASLGN